MNSTTPVALMLLGGMEARGPSGELLALPAGKVRALLAYLARHPGQSHPRDKLAALIWDDAPADRARHRLRQSLVELRRALATGRTPVLREDGDALALDPVAVSVDVTAFEAAVAEKTPSALERAAALYRGDFLAGLRVQAAPFEAWLLHEREQLRERAVEALGRLLAHHLREDAVDAAVYAAGRLLALDPTQEAVHRTLMKLYVRQGRRGAALRQYQTCAHALRRELGLAPEAETRVLYRELLQLPTPAPRTDTPRPEATPPVGRLIGRESEMHALRQARDVAWRGHGRVVLVVGETGIGKSRLVAELSSEAGMGGGRIAVGRAYESASVLPFGVWLDAVRTAGLLDDIDLTGPALAELARLFPEFDAPRPHAGPPATPATRMQLFTALSELFQRVSDACPLVLALEDLHWADEMSLEVLGFLAERIAAWPVLVVGTVRAEELSGASALHKLMQQLGRDHPGSMVSLSPLSHDDTLELVRAHARPVDRADDALGRRLWELSTGNPLVVIETVHALYDRDLPADIATLPLASTIRETIARRLDRLGEPAAQVAGVVAVIGRDFDFDLLCRVSLLEASQAAEAVERLVGGGLLQASGERLGVTHERIQEVAYARLLEPARRLWHQRVAESMEDRARQRAEPLEPAALAHHFAAAGLVPQAVEHLSIASQRAIDQSAYAEAVAHARRALGLLPGLPDPAARFAHELALQLRLGEALIATRGYAAPDVQAAFARARELCEMSIQLGRPAQLFPAVAGLFHYYLTRGDVRTAAALATQLLAMASEDAPDHRVIAHLATADAAFWGGELASACAHLEHAMEVVRALPGMSASFGGHDALVIGDLYAAVIDWLRGLPDTAMTRIARATARARDLEHPHTDTVALFFAARIHRLRGELPQARQRIDDMAALSSRAGFSFWTLVGTIFRGYRIAELGDPETGVAHMERALVGYRTAGAELGLTFILTLLAEAQMWAGRCEDALHTVAQTQELSRVNGERFYEAELHRLRGELLAGAPGAGRDGDAEPERCFVEALRVARAQGARALELRAATSLGVWLGPHDGGRQSRATVAEIYRGFTEGRDTLDLQRARELLEAAGERPA